MATFFLSIIAAFFPAHTSDTPVSRLGRAVAGRVAGSLIRPGMSEKQVEAILGKGERAPWGQEFGDIIISTSRAEMYPRLGIVIWYFPNKEEVECVVDVSSGNPALLAVIAKGVAE